MINQLIGNYRITAALAEGGMGHVYRGRHQDLPREVVVKTIRLASFQTKDQEHLKARFLREAYIQSQLDHPNIVRVYEFIRGDENFYLVMQFIDGMSLRDLILRRGAIEPVHVLPLLKQSLAGLAYAHEFSYLDEAGNRHAGIIHRDIKPANLLLDGMGNLKITDFGIVKLAPEPWNICHPSRSRASRWTLARISTASGSLFMKRSAEDCRFHLLTRDQLTK